MSGPFFIRCQLLSVQMSILSLEAECNHKGQTYKTQLRLSKNVYYSTNKIQIYSEDNVFYSVTVIILSMQEPRPTWVP